jgi:hypothetical protein
VNHKSLPSLFLIAIIPIWLSPLATFHQQLTVELKGIPCRLQMNAKWPAMVSLAAVMDRLLLEEALTVIPMTQTHRVKGGEVEFVLLASRDALKKRQGIFISRRGNVEVSVFSLEVRHRRHSTPVNVNVRSQKRHCKHHGFSYNRNARRRSGA